MNPAQLLDPKGFAKEKAKKRTPNYGPKQTRKPVNTAEAVKLPTYDPKTLLNPKAAASSKAMKSSATADTLASSTVDGDISTVEPSENGASEGPNHGSLLDRHFGVTNREAPLISKRKVTDATEESDSDHKKQKTTFTGAGSGGIISEHLRKERETAAATNGPDNSTIDLTEDKDDEVVVLADKSHDKARSEEVCLGMLDVKLNCTMVPAVSTSAMNRLGKDYWPVARVSISRPPHSEGRDIIEVIDQNKKRFGRVNALHARHLVPLLDGADRSRLRVKAHLKARKRDPNDQIGQSISAVMDMTLTLYAPRDRALYFGKYLSTKQLYLRDPPFIDHSKELYNPHTTLPDYRPKVSSTAPKAQTYQTISYVSRTAEEMRREANSMFDDLVKNENIPEQEPDPSIKTPLLSHQKQALHFLLEHENTDFISMEDGVGKDCSQKFSLWRPQTRPNGRQMWYNVITNQEVPEKPAAIRGGILADMMGLGKTLSILSLIASTLEDSTTFRFSPLPDELKSVNGKSSKATLLVCPKSVLSNWEEQIQAHVRADAIKYYVYHGSSRTQDLDELGRYNIVLTSYGTLATEAKASSRNKRALMNINWFRIVLDEAHTIRNSNTAASKACCMLFGQRRWAVTGTPVQNRLDDLAALIKFIQVKPFDEPHAWAQYITAPFKNANSDVLQHLRLLVDSITLRRMKDSIGLVERTEKIVRLDFTDAEKALYAAFAARSNMKLKSLVKETDGLRGKSYAHVLRSLLRLRMICDHSREMLSDEDMEEIRGFDETTAIDLGDEPELVDQQFINERQAYEILQMQCDGDVDRCISCNQKIVKKITESPGSDDDDESTDSDEEKEVVMGYLTPCLHLLHPKCQQKHIEAVKPHLTADNYHVCPYCETYVRNEFFELTRANFDGYIKDKSNKARMPKKMNLDPDLYTPHTKINALLTELQQSAAESAKLPEGEPPIRSVVFTEWTTYLDLIEFAMESNFISYVRLDGSMSLRARADVLTRFRTDNSITVLLVSIRAGGQGLNFTAANKVYLMEPQFNPGVEQQAVDRVHRLGQTRDVEITHFIMRDSVEEGLLKLQEKKMKLAQLSMERKRTKEEEAKRRIEELRDLFK